MLQIERNDATHPKNVLAKLHEKCTYIQILIVACATRLPKLG